MWDKTVQYLKMFSSAVLTGFDAQGYPFSLRCVPQADAERQVLRIPAAEGLPLEAGPAGLLCHSHDELLWNLKSFQVLGRLEREGSAWIFRPERLLPGQGMGGPLEMFKAMARSQEEARKYLAKRGLERPKVRWDEFHALRVEAKTKK